MKILVVKDVEREDVEFVCKTLGCKPIASVDHFVPENMGSADLVEEVQTGSSKIVKVAVTRIKRGANATVVSSLAHQTLLWCGNWFFGFFYFPQVGRVKGMLLESKE